MFDFKYKIAGEKKWRDISENFLRTIIKKFFPAEDLEAKIMDIKLSGHTLKIREVTIEAWPKEKKNDLG
jgi:hypothetical protein